MKLVELEIRNYRSIFPDAKDHSFALAIGEGVNVIAGPNNTGKSNIFRALDLALNPDTPFDRSLDMPAVSQWAKPTITLTFQVGKVGREGTLRRYLEEYETKVKRESGKTYAADGMAKLRVTIESSGDATGQRRSSFVARGAGARSLSEGDPLTVKALAQFNKCFHFVLVRSGDSLTTLMEGKFRDTLHNVLREELREQFRSAEASRTRYLDELRDGLLNPLTARVSSELTDLFPEISTVLLQPDIRTLDEALALMRVSVSDCVMTDLESKGTGVRGGLIIAMLRHFVEVGKRSMLFAVEEPESFLHPAAQEQLRVELEDLAERDDVSLLVTSHSPYIISRAPQSRVFAIEKDAQGRTQLLGSAKGDDRHAALLGGLFRNRLLAEVLDRSLHVPAEAELIVVVEGWTDRRFIEIALERSGRGDLLKRLAIVEAGLSLPAEQAGGSALAVAQALITRATSTLPVVALLDNDEPGRKAAHDLRAIGDKTGDWKKNQTVFTYACMFKGDAQFGYEAEDLWPNAVIAEFTRADEDGRLQAKESRPKPEGGWHYGIKAKTKADLVSFLEAEAKPAACTRWVALIELILDKALPKGKGGVP